MSTIGFDAYDYHADRSFARARYLLQGSPEQGWTVERDGRRVLELGAGYRALRVRQCGVCSTDLARHFLPFPLPQVIGHEVVAVDEQGARYVVEINASHAARGVASDCAFCAAGLETHCPERVTLGIDALPGGFGPWILAPVRACLPIPDEVADDDAVLVEPLAAALHAVTTVAPQPGERVAVLGPRRLGMLVVAGLHAMRDDYTVAAVVRDPQLAELARSFGADEAHVVGERDDELREAFDVVIDTTGSPSGLERALRLARREVHLKSTHGQPAAGVAGLTEFVVDELALTAMPDTANGRRVAWLADAEPAPALVAGADLRRGTAASLAAHYAAAAAGLPHADVAVVDSAETFAAAVRPVAGRERPLVRPRGELWLHPSTTAGASALLDAVATRGLRLSSSRCGDFGLALRLLTTPQLAGIGARLVTDRFDAAELPRAFEVAGSRACIKAVVRHGD
ncbi:MAG: alcohol dehydrogenase catalytic domain-containing protein [Planctomycetes bacterium]|nr:alcohol dehydrogenase catalytic domain-containing protein [Planctomycetota bacterium]